MAGLHKILTASMAAVLLTSCSTFTDLPTRPQDVAKARLFLHALQARDENRLEALTGRSWAKGTLSPDEENWFFGAGPPKGKSIQSIARKGGLSINIRRMRERGQNLIIVTYLDPALPALDSLKNADAHFMVDLFSCRFVVSDDQWMFETDMCYSEQDNPFASESYG